MQAIKLPITKANILLEDELIGRDKGLQEANIEEEVSASKGDIVGKDKSTVRRWRLPPHIIGDPATKIVGANPQYERKNIRLIFLDHRAEQMGFTPLYLTQIVVPYLDAIISIQGVIDQITGNRSSEVRILGISYGSVNVDVTGGIKETVELLMDTLVPWRRENKRKLADLELSDRELELKKKRSEIELAKSNLKLENKQAEVEAQNAEAERTKLLAEARKLEAETRQQEIANQKSQLELLQLTLDMLKKTAPNLPEEQRLFYAMRLIDPTRVIATSPLELVSVQVVESERKPQPDGTEPGKHPDQPTSEPDDKE